MRSCLRPGRLARAWNQPATLLGANRGVTGAAKPPLQTGGAEAQGPPRKSIDALGSSSHGALGSSARGMTPVSPRPWVPDKQLGVEAPQVDTFVT